MKRIIGVALLLVLVVTLVFALRKSNNGAIEASGSMKYKKQVIVYAPSINIDALNKSIDRIFEDKKQLKQLSPVSLPSLKPMGTAMQIRRGLGGDVAAGEELLVISNPAMNSLIKKAKAAVALANGSYSTIKSKREDASDALTKLSSANEKVDSGTRQINSKLAEINKNIARIEGVLKNQPPAKLPPGAQLSPDIKAKLQQIKILEAQLAKLKSIRAKLISQIPKLKSAKRTIRTNKSNVLSGIEKLDTAKIFGQLKITLAEINLDIIEFEATKLTVISPISGQIVEQKTAEGESVFTGQKLFELADTSEVSLIIYLPLEQAERVSKGEEVTVKIDSFPDKEFEGKVAFIAPNAEFAPTNMGTDKPDILNVNEITIEIKNEDGILKEGMQADVLFIN